MSLAFLGGTFQHGQPEGNGDYPGLELRVSQKT
jgi:hypothetical protein